MGDGTKKSRATPAEKIVNAQTTDEQALAMPAIKKVIAATDYTVALAADGSVYAWGSNADGRLINELFPQDGEVRAD